MLRLKAVKGNKKVSMPQFGDYNILFEYFIAHGLDTDYVVPPPITKHTLETGALYSPDCVCTPFKFTLGCFIEALEAGADTLVQVGGIVACRLKFYGELQEQILHDLGYKDITFVNLAHADRAHPASFKALLEQINPGYSIIHVLHTGLTVVTMLMGLDSVQAYMKKNIGFEVNEGDFRAAYERYLSSLRSCRNSVPAAIFKKSRVLREMKRIPTDKPEDPIRIGVAGEFYTAMDDFSQHDIERKMAKYGMSVERWLNLTNTIIKYKAKPLRRDIRRYDPIDMGVTTTSNVHFALDCAKKGFDGLIHVKSVGCTPEIDDMPAIENIGRDYGMPVLFFSFDCQSGDTGTDTRLEAFSDMIKMKREKNGKNAKRIYGN